MKTKYVIAVVALTAFSLAQAEAQKLLNASYDISRELFAAYNPLFEKHWQVKTGNTVEIKQSHAGSSKQANAILHGLKADVVTFNQTTDVQVLADKGFVAKDWASRLPNNGSPYYSTTAFLVRKGNPKQVQDWGDLVKPDVKVVFPNPKTSGNGRYTYLAALGYAQEAFDSEDKQYGYLKDLLSHVVVFDTGGRGATTSFVERQLGDVLITFESEVNNIKKQYPDEAFEVVVPKVSILAEFPVAVVDKVADKNGTAALAKEYLTYLYSPEAQALLASFNYRVHDKAVAEKYAAQFPELKLKTIDEIAGGWENAMKTHFASGGKLEQLQAK